LHNGCRCCTLLLAVSIFGLIVAVKFILIRFVVIKWHPRLTAKRNKHAALSTLVAVVVVSPLVVKCVAIMLWLLYVGHRDCSLLSYSAKVSRVIAALACSGVP